MVYRFLRSVLNNEKIIAQLADSWPIRAAAKFIVRGVATADEKVSNLKIGDKLDKYTKIYKDEYKKAIEKK